MIIKRVLTAATIAAIGLLTTPAIAHAESIATTCDPLHGAAYIRCRETGNNPAKYANGQPHPGPSSASGQYGLLDSTRRIYGTATNYMQQRYGSWVTAEAHERRYGWW